MSKLKFCDSCGKPLMVEKTKQGIIGVCSCGFKSEEIFEISSFEETIKVEEKGEGIIEHSKEIIENTFPHICRKCGHNGAEVIDVGVKVSDEAGIYLFRCAKCSFTERQADGSCNM